MYTHLTEFNYSGICVYNNQFNRVAGLEPKSGSAPCRAGIIHGWFSVPLQIPVNSFASSVWIHFKTTIVLIETNKQKERTVLWSFPRNI